MVPGLAFLVVALVAWRWPVIGGSLLVLADLIALIGYPLMVRDRLSVQTVISVLLTMAVPPLLAGALLILRNRRLRSSGISPDPALRKTP